MDKLFVEKRPKKLKDFVGHEITKKALKKFIKESSSGTFLFTGDRGTGKTTLSRICKNELRVNELNFKEYTVSTEAKVEMAREIVEEVKKSSMVKGNRLFILNEIHQAKKQFQDILLDVLENPPKNTFIILCTTEPEKLKKPVKSRCISFYLGPLCKKDSFFLLNKIAEEIEFELTEKITSKIYLKAEGIPREMLNILEVCSKVDSEEDQFNYIDSYSGIAEESDIVALNNALLKKKKFSDVMEIVDGLNSDPESIRRGILWHSGLVLKKNNNASAALIINCFSENYYDTGFAGLYLSIFNVLS